MPYFTEGSIKVLAIQPLLATYLRQVTSIDFIDLAIVISKLPTFSHYKVYTSLSPFGTFRSILVYLLWFTVQVLDF